RDDECAGGIHRNGNAGPVGDGDGVAVDAEVGAERGSAGIETAAEKSIAHARVGMKSAPDDHEVAVGIHGGRGLIVLFAGVAVDAEFAADANAAGVVALGIDALIGAILRPRD